MKRLNHGKVVRKKRRNLKPERIQFREKNFHMSRRTKIRKLAKLDLLAEKNLVSIALEAGHFFPGQSPEAISRKRGFFDAVFESKLCVRSPVYKLWRKLEKKGMPVKERAQVILNKTKGNGIVGKKKLLVKRLTNLNKYVFDLRQMVFETFHYKKPAKLEGLSGKTLKQLLESVNASRNKPSSLIVRVNKDLGLRRFSGKP